MATGEFLTEKKENLTLNSDSKAVGQKRSV